MYRVLAHRPSPAMLVALLALFVSLGGNAFAALSINSVGTTQLKSGAVTTRKIRNGAVTTGKIRNGAVTGAKLNLAGVTVPNALHATDAGHATSATNATNATDATTATNATNAAHATTATTATNATDAAELGGQLPSAYLSSSLFGSPAALSVGTVGDPSCVLGEVKLYAGSPPLGDALAAGQLLSIAANTALFTLIGTTYGGNGTTNFALPDLRGAEPKGRGPHGISYYICTQGTYP